MKQNWTYKMQQALIQCNFAKKDNLVIVKLDTDKLDISKLETNLVDLSKLSDEVKNKVIKKTEYN